MNNLPYNNVIERLIDGWTPSGTKWHRWRNEHYGSYGETRNVEDSELMTEGEARIMKAFFKQSEDQENHKETCNSCDQLRQERDALLLLVDSIGKDCAEAISGRPMDHIRQTVVTNSITRDNN